MSVQGVKNQVWEAADEHLSSPLGYELTPARHATDVFDRGVDSRQEF